MIKWSRICRILKDGSCVSLAQSPWSQFHVIPGAKVPTEVTTHLGVSLSKRQELCLPVPNSAPYILRLTRVGLAEQGARLTFQEGGALLDVGPQLLENAIDLLLGGDKVLEREAFTSAMCLLSFLTVTMELHREKSRDIAL